MIHFRNNKSNQTFRLSFFACSPCCAGADDEEDGKYLFPCPPSWSDKKKKPNARTGTQNRQYVTDTRGMEPETPTDTPPESKSDKLLFRIKSKPKKDDPMTIKVNDFVGDFIKFDGGSQEYYRTLPSGNRLK